MVKEIKPRFLKDCRISIKGTDWSVRLMTRKQFEKVHYGGGEGPDDGMTTPSTKTIDLVKEAFLIDTLYHELFHAFFAECLTNSSELTASQTEEQSAMIVGQHLEDILKCANSVFKAFLPL